MKKTVSLNSLVEKTNNYLAYHGTITKEMRLGACATIETALHDCKAYAGFSYLPEAYDANKNIVDDSRRVYHLRSKWACESVKGPVALFTFFYNLFFSSLSTLTGGFPLPSRFNLN